jgi:hypothetical protein
LPITLYHSPSAVFQQVKFYTSPNKKLSKLLDSPGRSEVKKNRQLSTQLLLLLFHLLLPQLQLIRHLFNLQQLLVSKPRLEFGWI